MNKKYTIYLTILLISAIIITILIPPFNNNIFNNKIIEGASGQTTEEEIRTNLTAINQDKIKIQELIQQKNESVSTPSDITTSTARLDYTTLENKSLNIQIIILSFILLIIVIAIISIFMS